MRHGGGQAWPAITRLPCELWRTSSQVMSTIIARCSRRDIC